MVYEGTFNILDKIAHYINEYLSLGIKHQRIHFGTIWYEEEESKKAIKQKILANRSRYLYALHDMSLDIWGDGDWSDLRRLRNDLTHQYVSLHVEGGNFQDEPDGAQKHLMYGQMYKKAVELLQVIRSAIIYLMAFTHYEYLEKRSSMKGIIGIQELSDQEDYPTSF